ncbi:Transmembrane protein [Parasponia andersonii]|uniref:Transmembrane protein n=1 Tax=Parasponia andersonii TaxID=3476 RepID=A0A2P5B6G9_PARAD|nr:Transmembrane protein [Parasponia andersonii]
MAPESSPESFERINLQGKNSGASFSLHRGDGSDSHDCCCINIYINNNVEGATNSVLYESEVQMRDPGVHLFFGDVKLGTKSKRTNKKRKNKTSRSSTTNVGSLFAFVISILFLLSLFSII